MIRRTALLLLVLWSVAGTSAAGAEPRTYAVLSLLGDKLLVAQQQFSTGTNVKRTHRSQVALGEAVLDDTALSAVEAALKQADPTADPQLVAMQDAAADAEQEKLLEGGGSLIRLIEPTLPQLKAWRATHAIVILKHRQEAVFRLQSSSFGSGQVEGAGFYVDRSIISERPESNMRDRGAIAPFVYFRIALIDLARMEVVNDERIAASSTRTNADSASNNPWGAMTTAEKIEALQSLIRQEVARVMPGLLRESKR